MTTAIPESLPSAAPPADPTREEHIVLTTVPQALHLEVPQISLMDSDKIVRHPDDGAQVSWRITSRSTDDDGRLVIHYTHPDGEDAYTFRDPVPWVWIETGMVLR